MERLCVEAWGMFLEGTQKKYLVDAVKANGKDKAARAASNMGLKNDALRAMLYAAHVVPANIDEVLCNKFLNFVTPKVSLSRTGINGSS